MTSLLRILIRQHLLQLHTHTPVTSIDSPTSAQRYYTLHTPRGAIKARRVINATNAWIGHLYPEFREKIIPTRGQVIHVDGRGLQVSPMGWNHGDEYLVQRTDDSLIFGGGRRFSSDSTIPFIIPFNIPLSYVPNPLFKSLSPASCSLATHFSTNFSLSDEKTRN